MTHPLVVNRANTKTYDIYVGRPTEWGNPFREGVHGDRDQVCDLYEKWLADHPEVVEAAREQLAGKVLACWCAPLRCHADLLAQVANS